MAEQAGDSLYAALGEPSPALGSGAETSITATKETIDADRENVADDTVLLGD